MKSINKKKKSGLKGLPEKKPDLITRYNEMDARSNVKHALIKTLVDVIAGVMIGPALSATLGKVAPIAGLGLSFGGHYMGDQTGLMRGIGMSTLAHSVAKTKEYRQADSTLKERLSELKDDWLRLILLKKTDVPKLGGIVYPDEVKRAIEQEIFKEQIQFDEPEPEFVYQSQPEPEYLDNFQDDSWKYQPRFHEEPQPVFKEEENWDDVDFSQF